MKSLFEAIDGSSDAAMLFALVLGLVVVVTLDIISRIHAKRARRLLPLASGDVLDRLANNLSVQRKIESDESLRERCIRRLETRRPW